VNRQLARTPRQTHRNLDGAAADVDATHTPKLVALSDDAIRRKP
jgi:hypothetical protein